MSLRPSLRLAAGAALAVGLGAACGLLVHALEHRVGLCADSLVEGPGAAAGDLPVGAPLPHGTTAATSPAR